MKLGVSAFARTDSLNSSHLCLLPEIREAGFSGSEIPIFDPAVLPIAAHRKAFEGNDLECTVCAILPLELTRSVRCRSSQAFSCPSERMCRNLCRAGSSPPWGPLFAPIGYQRGHRPTEDEWNWAVEAFQSLRGLLDQHSMTLSIEPVNRAESFFLRTAAEGRELCHDIAHPRVGITIDTFHANIEEKSIPEALVTLGSYLKHLHISENDRGLLGTGHVPFPEIIKALDQIGYEGYLMIEGFGFLQMNRMLREHYGQIPTCLPNPLPCKGSRIYRH